MMAPVTTFCWYILSISPASTPHSLIDHLLERAGRPLDARIRSSKRIARVLDLLPLSPQIPQDISSDILCLQCDAVGIVQPP